MSAWQVMLRRFRWRPGGWLQASTGLFGWLFVRALAQAALVLFLARLLGATAYGQFVSLLALASFFTPLAGLGLHAVLLRDGAREPAQLPGLLNRALRLWLAATAVFSLIAWLVILLFLPGEHPGYAVLVFAGAEVAAGSLVEIVGRSEQARHETSRFGALLAGLSLIRLGALGSLSALATPTLTLWLLAYATASLSYTVCLGAWVLRKRAAPIGAPTRLIREGLPFAIGALSLRLQTEFNKPVLAHLGYAEVGYFGIAQRITDFASLPLMALQEALWPRVYAASNPTLRLRRTGAVVVAFALLGGAAIALLSPLLPKLLGHGYTQATPLLIALAGLPATQVIRNLGNARLVARGQSSRLTQIYLVGSLIGVVLTTGLVLLYGMLGAVGAAYATEVILIILQLRVRRPDTPVKARA